MQNNSCTDEAEGAEHMRGKVITWRGMIVIAGVFLLAFLVGLAWVYIARRPMEEQSALRQDTIVRLEQEVAELRTELERVGTDGYVEIQARTNFDYVRNGEIRFEFSDPDRLSYYTEEEWDIIMEEELYDAY